MALWYRCKMNWVGNKNDAFKEFNDIATYWNTMLNKML